MGGWICPQSIPETKVCRVLKIPAEPFIFAAINGALLDLKNPANWQALPGSVTPEQIAEVMEQMWIEYSTNVPCP